MFGASSELASVMEFGLYQLVACLWKFTVLMYGYRTFTNFRTTSSEFLVSVHDDYDAYLREEAVKNHNRPVHVRCGQRYPFCHSPGNRR